MKTNLELWESNLRKQELEFSQALEVAALSPDAINVPAFSNVQETFSVPQAAVVLSSLSSGSSAKPSNQQGLIQYQATRAPMLTSQRPSLLVSNVSSIPQQGVLFSSQQIFIRQPQGKAPQAQFPYQPSMPR